MEQIDWSKAPEGATHWDPIDCNHLRQFSHFSLVWNNKIGWTQHQGQYENNLDSVSRLIRRPSWNGTGLPPVGTVCEFAGFNPEETLPTDPLAGDKVTVIAHFKSGEIEVAAFTFYAPPEFEYLQVAQGAYGCFRPIRTPEQIAEDLREDECERMVEVINASPWGMTASPYECAALLYDYGYRKFEIVPE